MADITKYLHNLIDKGHTHAKFAEENNAKIFASILKMKKGLDSEIYKILGHADTVETVKHRLHHHFVVVGQDSTSKVLKKFV